MFDVNELLKAGLIGGILGAIGSYLGRLIFQRGSKLNCPRCGTAVPQTRKPANWHQFWWGGWTCSNCGCEMDRKGKSR